MAVRHGVKTSIETVRQWAISLGGKLLSNNYDNMLTKLKWQCNNDHIFETTFNHVKNRGQWCPECGRKKGLKSMRRTLEKPEIKKKISASHQKIDIKDWNGFVAKKNKKLRKKERSYYRYHNDIMYKLKLIIRSRAKRAVETIKGARTISRKEMSISLGCSIDDFKKHIESQFTEGMSWENHSLKGWHIDHIKPLSLFNLIDPEEQKKACHYTNLQPLWAKDNLSKGAKYGNQMDEKTHRRLC